MQIDRRVRATEFMGYLGCGRKKFYEEIKKGNIKTPTRLSKKDVFWYESYVKSKVEEFKDKDDMIAC